MEKFYRHNNLKLHFSGENGSAFGMKRLETADMENDNRAAEPKAPFILRTDNVNVNMEGCASIVPGTEKIVNSSEDKDGVTLVYEKGGLEITAVLKYTDGADVVRQTVTVKNTSDKTQKLTHVSSALINGLCTGGLLKIHDKRKVKVHYCRSHWQGEAQWRTSNLVDLGIYHKTAHAWDTMGFRISSTGSWSTGRYYPLVMLEDAECGKIWYMELEGAYDWTIEVGNENGKDGGMLFMEANCADQNQNGFVYDLKPGESYTAPSCVYGCTTGGFDEAVRELLKYKRAATKGHWDAETPACFNDYMDCIWGRPSREKLVPLIDAASKAGCEVFCMDAGWYIGSNGLWQIDNSKYGEGGLAGIIDYIKQKKMIPGIWLEIESVTKGTPLYQKDLLLCRNGEIVNPDRANADFTRKQVRDYIMGVFDMLYGMGIRFVKNDYNMSVMLGSDNDGDCPAEGLRKTTDAFYSFIDEVKAKYPDLKIENCGSGAMRCDNGTLSHFELQSTSDQEFYYNNTSIISGTLAYLAPEKAGIWSYPYPISYYENRDKINVWENKDYVAQRADGEETVYNMVNALMGTLYLSGRIEHADKKNFALVKEGVKAFKKYRKHNASAHPVWPCGVFNLGDDSFTSLGLVDEKAKKMTLAVWRLNSPEDTIVVDLSKYLAANSKVSLAYPSDPMGAEFVYNPSSKLLTVKLPKRCSARFFEIRI